MGTAEVERFLKAHAPFSGLAPEMRTDVAARVQVRFFPAGSEILRQGGEPSRFLFVVRTGSVELLDGVRVVDLLEEGGAFGHPSLLAGIEPIYGAAAREDTICYLLPEDVVRRVFGDPTGLGFLAASLRRRVAVVERAGSLRAADPRLARVDSLVQPPLVADGAEPIAAVAGRMARERTSAVLVRDDGIEGIVTDADLRGRVVAAGTPGGRPVREVMSAPVRSVPGERLVREAILDMLGAGTRHLGVHDASGRIVGLLTERDLLAIERRDPFEIRAEIDRGLDVDAVATAARRVPSAIAHLAGAGLDAPDLARVVATMTDAATGRLLELALARIGPAPVAWAWLALGSQARREQALATDQDHALVWEGGAEHDGWFAGLASEVVTGLEACGIPRCESDVMATAPAWRGPLDAFVDRFRAWITAPASQPAFATGIALDHRVVAGPLDPSNALDRLRDTARATPTFLWRLTRLALEASPPLGFRGNVVVGTIDDEPGVLDLKAGGLLPVTDLARVVALRAGLGVMGTIDRLRGAAAADALDQETAGALEESFRVFLDVRLEHQRVQVERGRAPDNLIDPGHLGRIERGRLRAAFRIVAGVQKDLGREATRTRFR